MRTARGRGGTERIKSVYKTHKSLIIIIIIIMILKMLTKIMIMIIKIMLTIIIRKSKTFLNFVNSSAGEEWN